MGEDHIGIVGKSFFRAYINARGFGLRKPVKLVKVYDLRSKIDKIGEHS